MRDKIIRIALPKLFLWNEASRFQEYPAAMARAKEDRIYTRLEVERELFDIRPTLTYRGGAPRGRQTDGIVNTYGLEKSGERHRINGIDLLRKEKTGIVVTESGLSLGKLFREAPHGEEWPVALARQLLLREPRTRLVVGLLLKGFTLEIELSGTTLVGLPVLIDSEGNRMTITSAGCTRFNEFLNEHATMALGPLWLHELENWGASGAVRWEGVQKGHPSLSDLSAALKKSLTLFFHIQLFDGDGKHWNLDPGRLESVLGEEAVESFGISTQTDTWKLSEDEAFVLALTDLKDAEGFVIVSRLAERFGEVLGIPESDRLARLDSFIRDAMYHERLRIIEHHPGQPRMGRGLFGISDSRRVRIDFE